jgi:hypothetical protein
VKNNNSFLANEYFKMVARLPLIASLIFQLMTPGVKTDEKKTAQPYSFPDGELVETLYHFFNDAHRDTCFSTKNTRMYPHSYICTNSFSQLTVLVVFSNLYKDITDIYGTTK